MPGCPASLALLIKMALTVAEAGSVITPFYDSLLVKVTASGRNFNIALQRMDRALREFRIRGVKTNIPFLENVIWDETFRSGQATTTLIDTTPELFKFRPRRDRGGASACLPRDCGTARGVARDANVGAGRPPSRAAAGT